MISPCDLRHVNYLDQVRRAPWPTKADSSWKTTLSVTRCYVPADTRGGLQKAKPQNSGRHSSKLQTFQATRHSGAVSSVPTNRPLMFARRG